MDPLTSLAQKMQVVIDHVTAVGLGLQKGLYLYGSGGVGKSYTVLGQLKALDVSYKLFNSRMTGKGLFSALGEAPDAIHVLEDMERLTKDPDAQGVLRSALWAQPGHDREVTWTTAKKKEDFIFRGGIILISNCPLANLPELDALATRILVHRVDVSDAELTAMMRDLAAKGYAPDGKRVLPPEECQVVTEFLLTECRAAGCPLDLRLQQKAFQTYRQFAADQAKTHWHDLIAACVRETTIRFRYAPDKRTPEERKAARRNAVRKVMAQTADGKEQVRLYAELTGASRADFFRRKPEVESGEFDAADAS